MLLLSSFLGVFITTFNCFNMLYSPLKRHLKFFLWIGNFTISLSIAYLFNSSIIAQYSTYILLAYTLFIIILNKQNSLINCILFLFGYLIQVTLNYICMLPGYIIYKDISFAENILFMLFYVIICGLVTRYIGKATRNHFTIKYYVEHKKLLIVIAVFVLTCASLFILNFAVGENAAYPSHIAIINSILFISYFTLTTILLFFIIKSIKRETEEKQKLAEYKNLQEYTQKLEELYQQMRSFKHDYINILSTMDCYIEQGDFASMSNYFYSKILPTGKQFSKDTASLGKLANVHILELKSILYQKFMKASSLHLNLEIDIPEPFNTINCIDPMELSRLLGIFLDNAIESALETEKKNLFCGILKSDNEIIIAITNSCNDLNVPIENLFQEGFTTKSSGHGIGLYNAKQILNAYPHILHHTKYQHNVFTQELHIPIP